MIQVTISIKREVDKSVQKAIDYNFDVYLMYISAANSSYKNAL